MSSNFFYTNKFSYRNIPLSWESRPKKSAEYNQFGLSRYFHITIWYSIISIFVIPYFQLKGTVLTSLTCLTFGCNFTDYIVVSSLTVPLTKLTFDQCGSQLPKCPSNQRSWTLIRHGDVLKRRSVTSSNFIMSNGWPGMIAFRILWQINWKCS